MRLSIKKMIAHLIYVVSRFDKFANVALATMAGSIKSLVARFLSDHGSPRPRTTRAMFLADGIKRNGIRGEAIMMIMLMIVTMAAHRPC